MSKLEVYIDFKSPYAYIAKDPTWALEAEFGIEVDWYPLGLNIGSYLGTARTDKRGKVTESKRSPRQWLAVKYAYYDARRYANLRDLTLYGTQKIWDTTLASLGLLWAKDQGREPLKQYLDLTYDQFWKRALDVEDVEVVKTTLQEAGASVSGFDDYASGEGLAAFNQLQEDILDRGYFGVPTYVIDGVSYFGREHLPRVRWHLAGREGPMPDVANDTRLSQPTLQGQPGS